MGFAYAHMHMHAHTWGCRHQSMCHKGENEDLTDMTTIKTQTGSNIANNTLWYTGILQPPLLNLKKTPREHNIFSMCLCIMWDMFAISNPVINL